MTLRARLSWWSPPRLKRYRTVLPEEAGSWLAPARAANAASFRCLPGYAHATSMVAAVTGPIPASLVRSAAGCVQSVSTVVCHSGQSQRGLVTCSVQNGLLQR